MVDRRAGTLVVPGAIFVIKGLCNKRLLAQSLSQPAAALTSTPVHYPGSPGPHHGTDPSLAMVQKAMRTHFFFLLCTPEAMRTPH